MDERFFKKVTTQELMWRLEYAQKRINTWLEADEGWYKLIDCRDQIEKELDKRINLIYKK